MPELVVNQAVKYQKVSSWSNSAVSTCGYNARVAWLLLVLQQICTNQEWYYSPDAAVCNGRVLTASFDFPTQQIATNCMLGVTRREQSTGKRMPICYSATGCNYFWNIHVIFYTHMHAHTSTLKNGTIAVEKAHIVQELRAIKWS